MLNTFIVSSYDSKSIEYKEISRHGSYVNCLHSIEDVLNNYQAIFGGTGDIPRFEIQPYAKEHKEGLFIIQNVNSRLVLFNRVREIGYVYNTHTDNFVCELVISKICVDNKIRTQYEEEIGVFYKDHKAGMKEVYEYVKEEGKNRIDDNQHIKPVPFVSMFASLVIPKKVD